jgi:type IV pilus assembly protein PilA
MQTKVKAFTLIELLVVVAIIGILAAVGVVAYSGYTKGAKKNAVKSNFKLVQKYVLAELMKCEIGHTDIFINSGKYKVSCSAVHDAHRTSAAMVFDPSLRFLNPIDNGIWNREDQLVLMNDNYKGSSIPDNIIGYILLNFKSTWPASIRSCFETPCSNSDNVLTATLNY